MTVSIVLPVYNERENVGPLLSELAEVLAAYPDSQVIAVDDGSTDGTTETLRALTARYPFLTVLVLARNFGQTAAMAAGTDHAKGDIIIPMDADGQNDPHDIPHFLAEIDKGFDVVSGWRADRRDGFLRSVASRMANRIIRYICKQEIHDYGCTMKAYRRSVLENMTLYGDMHRFLAAYTSVQGARVSEIVVHHRPRLNGQSKYGFGRVWRVLLDLVLLVFFLHSVTRPMHFFGGIGLFLGFAGLGTILLAAVIRFAGGPTLIETPLPTLSALFIIIGMQCILMGVLAEMSMRSYFQGQGRKSYLIRAILPAPHAYRTQSQ